VDAGEGRKGGGLLLRETRPGGVGGLETNRTVPSILKNWAWGHGKHDFNCLQKVSREGGLLGLCHLLGSSRRREAEENTFVSGPVLADWFCCFGLKRRDRGADFLLRGSS